jgi:WD40 repeat protein
VSLTNHVQLNRNGQFAWAFAQAEGVPAGSLYRIFVWNVNAGQKLSSNILFSNLVSGASLSDDGRRIVIFGGNIAQIWDVGFNKPLCPPLIHPHTVSGALFNHDGTRVATRVTNSVRIWDCLTATPCFHELKHPVDVNDFAFSPDGSLLATCCLDQTTDNYFAQVWDSGTGQPVSPPLKHRDGVLCVAFSPDGKRLVTGGEDFIAMVWDARIGNKLTQPLRHTNQVESVAFSSNGRLVVTVSANVVRIWDSESGDPVTPPLRNLVWVSNAKFLPGGMAMAVCNSDDTAWKCRFPADPISVADLGAIARLLSGGSDDTREIGPVRKSGHLELTWQRLASEHPFYFNVSPEQVAAYQEFQAAECEKGHNWLAAAFHLSQLSHLRPADQTLRQRLVQAQEHLKAAN